MRQSFTPPPPHPPLPPVSFPGVYLDFTDLVLQDAGAQRTTVVDGFFLGGAQLLFRTTSPGGVIEGTALLGNVWRDTQLPPFGVDAVGGGAWASVTDLTVSGTGLQSGQPYVGPVASMAASAPTHGDEWGFDFAPQLLFPGLPPAVVTWTLSGALGAGDTGVANSGVLNVTGAGATPHVVRIVAPGSAAGGYAMAVRVEQSRRVAA